MKFRMILGKRYRILKSGPYHGEVGVFIHAEIASEVVKLSDDEYALTADKLVFILQMPNTTFRTVMKTDVEPH
jgi:hypothetical protein